MIGWLSSLLLLLVPGAAAAPSSAPSAMPQGRVVAWPHDGSIQRVTVAGLTLVNTSRACTARDSTDADPGHCWVAGVRIERPGAAAVSLEGPAGMLGRIAAGTTTRGGAPIVILTTFTGGAHCCEVYDIAISTAGRWQTTRLTWRPPGSGAWGEPQTRFDGGLARFPRDIDGDGVADFVLSDDRFAYAFGSYAGSAPPPIVLDWADGRWVDVSTRPRFAALYRRDAATRRTGCLDPAAFEHAGVCAGWAADAARLGTLAQVWPLVVAHGGHDQGTPGWTFRDCGGRFSPVPCPAGGGTAYPTYPAALRAFLTAAAYLPQRTR